MNIFLSNATLNNLVHAFVPLLVAVDPFGMLPIFAGLTEGLDAAARRKVLRDSIITATVISIAFILFGNLIFRYMGIESDDFKIAGGALLFVFSTIDIISSLKIKRRMADMVGVVPLGTPLIAGPAVLTTSLILVGSGGDGASGVPGLWPTLAALVANLLLVWAILRSSEFWTRLIGIAGSKALSKVVSLILAAFAVMMIRKGIMGFIHPM